VNLEVGDLVLLRSGGAICTVTELFDTHVEVAWSDGKHNYQSTYPCAALRKVQVTELPADRTRGASH
jgi:uncharacterized protein YodC (DUF2158 family)